MAYNKVIYDGNTLIDLTEDTVTSDNLIEGLTAHNSKGEPIDTLPIFYTRKIEDRSRVSTDFSRSMMVYLSAS